MLFEKYSYDDNIFPNSSVWKENDMVFSLDFAKKVITKTTTSKQPLYNIKTTPFLQKNTLHKLRFSMIKVQGEGTQIFYETIKLVTMCDCRLLCRRLIFLIDEFIV